MLAEANVAAIASSRDGTQAQSKVSSLLCNFKNPQISFSPHRTFSHLSQPTLTQVTSLESVYLLLEPKKDLHSIFYKAALKRIGQAKNANISVLT